MAVAFDKRRRREYVPVCDREKPEAERTVFILRQLDVWGRTKIADFRAEGLGQGMMTMEIIRLALDGWRNFLLPGLAEGDKPSDAPFVRRADGLPSNDTIGMIQDEWANELMNELVAWEEVTQKTAGE